MMCAFTVLAQQMMNGLASQLKCRRQTVAGVGLLENGSYLRYLSYRFPLPFAVA